MRYTVRRADGELFGPLNLDQVKQMIQAGQVHPDDMLALIGQTFQPFRSFSELQHLFPRYVLSAPSSMDLSSGEIGATELLEGLQPVKIIIPDEQQANFATYAGDLKDVPFARVYYSLYIYNQTGRLILSQSEDKTREIYFLRGVPWIIKLPTEEDDLPQLLLDGGFCTFDEISEGMARASERSTALGDQLVAMNAIAPGQLYQVLQDQFRLRLMSTFHWRVGRFLFFSNHKPKESGLPLNLDNLLLLKEGIASSHSLSDLQWVMEPYYNKALSKMTHPQIRLEELRFSSKEARMYNLLGRGENVWQFISRIEQLHVATLEEILRFLYFLGAIDMIQIGEQSLWPPISDNLRLLQGATT
ncbi:MAG: hypothetical protein EP343_09700 [Deltaproteobacteria bacterium]|nr:MAG: hypothetical protein EP343_09700 [Deltaproteobacteria bacterium]